MSDTPRTDGAVFVVFSSPSNDVEAVDADFARELERENIKLRERIAFEASMNAQLKEKLENKTNSSN